jgi:(2Fe-2S) ferredoxin
MRTKAACLRICHEGPWLVVYPEGIWYGRLDGERLRRILQEHVVEGRPVTEWIATRMPNLKTGA